MARKIIAGILLGFVVIALATIAVRGRSGDGGAAAAPGQDGAPAAASAPPATAAGRLVAFYFHGAKRCQSCNSIERLTREALQAEVAGGRIEIRSVDVDEPAQAHFVDDFQLTMRTVVLAEERAGRIGRWRRLDECWDRFGDAAGFTAYVRSSLEDFRSAPPAAP